MAEEQLAIDTSPRILVVDDEVQFIRVIRPTLNACGYQVSVAEDGAQAVTMAAAEKPDVILLDLGLPDQDGKKVIEQVREWSRCPIIVLSARHDVAERIAALDTGADDYLVKPFDMGELEARLRTALRHRDQQRDETPVFRTRDLEIDFVRRRVTVEGMEIRLTRKEYDLLRLLAQHAGQVVTHKQLLLAGWGGSVTDTQFVRVYVGQLRQKLEADSARPQLILTEPGVGYRLAMDD